jgi:dipeptidyl aminopeptidase/acylaminoacyl peptidase
LIFWGGVCAGIDTSRHNPVEYAASCRCPTLLLHGEQDLNAKLDEAKNVQSRLNDREAELVIFPKAGHVPTLVTDSRLWHDAISRLLKRVAATR